MGAERARSRSPPLRALTKAPLSEAQAPPADDSKLCSLDEDMRAHLLLLEECHRKAAVDELRDKFEKTWTETWPELIAVEVFFAFLIHGLRSEKPIWPPLPGAGFTEKSAYWDLIDNASSPIRYWGWWHVSSEWPYVPETCNNQAGLDSFLAHLRTPEGHKVLWEALLTPVDLDIIEPELRKLNPADDTYWGFQKDAIWIFRKKAGDNVERWIRQFTYASMQSAIEIREKWMDLFEEAKASHCRDPLRIVSERTTSPDSNAVASMSLTLHGELPSYLEGKVTRAYNLKGARAEKLQSLFDAHGAKIQGAVSFSLHCWNMLARYHALFGPENESAGMHMAITPGAVSSLKKEFEVSHELFASPLNCSLPGYCSVCEDTDRYFGSSGSFYDFCRLDGPLVSQGGSYECGPPYDESVIHAMFNDLTKALQTCTKPLSLAVILPNWVSNKDMQAASKSRFCKGRIQIWGEHHIYLNGLQHCCEPDELRVLAEEGRGSLIIMMQNEAGSARWPVTEEILQRHIKSW